MMPLWRVSGEILAGSRIGSAKAHLIATARGNRLCAIFRIRIFNGSTRKREARQDSEVWWPLLTDAAGTKCTSGIQQRVINDAIFALTKHRRVMTFKVALTNHIDLGSYFIFFIKIAHPGITEQVETLLSMTSWEIPDMLYNISCLQCLQIGEWCLLTFPSQHIQQSTPSPKHPLPSLCCFHCTVIPPSLASVTAPATRCPDVDLGGTI